MRNSQRAVRATAVALSAAMIVAVSDVSFLPPWRKRLKNKRRRKWRQPQEKP